MPINRFIVKPVPVNSATPYVTPVGPFGQRRKAGASSYPDRYDHRELLAEKQPQSDPELDRMQQIAQSNVSKAQSGIGKGKSR